MKVSGMLVLAVIMLTSAGIVEAQNAGVMQRLNIEFGPQKLGDRHMLAGEALIETTSVAAWRNPAVTFEVYDVNFTRKIKSGTVAISGQGSRRVAATAVRLDSAGVYAVVRRIEGVGAVDGIRHRYGFFWLVNVRWPVIASDPDSIYYYGENASFSFAAGHADQKGYAYTVLKDGEVVLSNDGAVVPIEKLWRGRLNDLGDFQVRGFYRGDMFRFADSTGRNPRSSQWTVRIEIPPEREVLSLWIDSLEFARRKAAGTLVPIDLAARTAFLTPLQFRFAASGPFYEGLYLIPARISSVEIVASPPEFLSGGIARPWKISTAAGGLWSVIEIQPSALFFERTPFDAPMEVTLRLRIVDEFGTITRRTYRSAVYSSRQ